MQTIMRSGTFVFRESRYLRVLTAGIVLTVGLSGAALADSAEMNAKLAISRAQASVDLVSKENPGATQDATYASAQRKLTEAQTAADHDENRHAVWLANESELLADTTASSAKLASLQHTRDEVAHDVDILATELHK